MLLRKLLRETINEQQKKANIGGGKCFFNLVDVKIAGENCT